MNISSTYVGSNFGYLIYLTRLSRRIKYSRSFSFLLSAVQYYKRWNAVVCLSPFSN